MAARDVDAALAHANQLTGNVLAFTFYNGGYARDYAGRPNYSLPSTLCDDGLNKEMYDIDGQVLSLDDVRRLNEQETHQEPRTRTLSSKTVDLGVVRGRMREVERHQVTVGNHWELIDGMERRGITHVVRDRSGGFKKYHDGVYVVSSK